MKLKKVLASILAVAMVLSTMSFTAFASGDTTADNAVASIGDQYYSTVALAMADAKANDTIVIHEDVTDLVSPAVAPLKFEAATDSIQVTGRAYLPKVDLVGSITYDGFEFSNTDWAVQQWDGQEKLNNVELVYKNCDFAEKGICISWHQDKPDWNLDKVTLDTCTAADAKEVFSFQYVDAVEIVNCDFSNATDRIINVSAASGDVTVENCNFGEGSIQLSQNVGDEERNLTVTDSTFTGEKAIVIHENLTNAEIVLAEIVITDNTVDESTEIVYFKDEEVAAVDYLAASEIVFSENVTSDNVEVTEISDGCEVANGSAVAVTVAAITKNGVTTNYTSLHDAVTAAQSGDVVEVLKDETYSVWNSVWNIENITINGNNHTLTVNSVDSNINGGGLFIKATDLTINDLTVVLPDNQTDGEMPRLATMYSGELNNVTVTGGTYVVSVLGGNGEVVINDCDFSGIDGWAVETEAQGNTSLTIQDSTFDEKAVIIRGDNTTFTGNTITATEKVEGVNVLGDTTITGNNFGASTLGIDQGITVVIENNIINSVEFPNWYAVENEDYSNLTVNENTLSDEATAAFTAALEDEVVSVDYVATNGDKFYYSLQDAVDAAQENDVIIVAADIAAEILPTADTTSNEDNALIHTDSDDIITLDLNGKTISVKGSDEAKFDTLAIRNHGNLTIVDSSIDKIGKVSLAFDGTQESGSSQIHSTILNFGTLNVNGGTIENTATTGYATHGIYNYSWGGNAVLTIENATISSNKGYGVFQAIYDDFSKNNNYVTINSGTINGGIYSWYQGACNDSLLAINGGTLNAGTDTEALRIRTSGSYGLSVVISDDVVINGEQNIKAAAKVGNKYYASIEAAIADAQENDTITILAGEYNAFTVPASKTGLTFIGETDADGNNLVTIKTMEQATDVSNAGIWTPTNPVVGVYAPVDGVTFENINFTAGTYTTNWMASSIGVHNEAFGKANNLVVRNCNFTGSGVGSAIWMWSGSVTVENCTITGYEDGVVSYNLNTGDAVIIDDSVIDVSNRAVQVANETLSALENGLAGTVTITDSEITGNLALEAYNSAVTDFAVSISDSTLIDATITATNAANVTMTNNLLLNSVINTKSTGTFNGVSAAENYDDAVEAVAENNEIIPTALNISFEEVEAGLYNIVLDGEDDIYEFVGAELTFANTSTTVAGEAMNYEILGIDGTTNAEKSIEKADTYALRLVDGADRMSGRDLVIGQVKFYGQGDINFTVAEGKVVTTQYGTNLGQYYTLDADETTTDTLSVNGITNDAVEEVTRTVVVNVAYKHALDGTYWKDAAGNAANQITVTLKDGFGNVYDAEDLTNGVATINNVKLGRLTVTLEAPGFRKYVYNTTLEAGADANDALVLNFWNNVKRNEELNGVVVEPLAEIETGKGFMAHNFVVGDIVMDYTVDEYDLAAVTSYYGMYELEDADKYIKYDLNRDGNIDIIDVHYVLHTLNN